MGTRGYVVIKYNGIYYIFYNNSDSYLSCLGINLLKDMNEIVKKNQIPHVKALFSKIPWRDEFTSGNDMHFYCIMDSLRYPSALQYITSYNKPSCDIFIEWIYTVDFDKNIFSIQNYDKHYQCGFFSLPDKLDEYDLIIDVDKNDIEGNITEENQEKNVDGIDDIDGIKEVDFSDDDTEEDIKLKIKILETNVKIYKMKLKLNKNKT
jgi:hypothetical protein